MFNLNPNSDRSTFRSSVNASARPAPIMTEEEMENLEKNYPFMASVRNNPHSQNG